ncbi:hypothetical protein GPECTOR_58g574 [Gonium pectorale]|uniref:Erythromycin esterase n=1 Tax=Gonium pectorale TaxID=33097 RepID=A0A150G6G9_GONPE|nr:hypothetical protein GPECTOR_58g574 [Gonium pectorale]|eukprot:KXZ45125.1 hypothetical protein GPECTOR_58g574 [Gonium pectorale]
MPPSRRGRGGVGAPGDEAAMVAAARSAAITAPTRGSLNAALLERIPASARFVMIGEASHGTREFYEQRAELTRLLISQRGFTAVLVESDWPDAFRVNRYVRGLPARHPTDGGTPGRDRSAAQALGDYKAARVVESRYRCFDRYGADAQSYGWATSVFHKASTVAAADEWGEHVQYKTVRPSLPGSYEHVMHGTGLPLFGLDLRAPELAQALKVCVYGTVQPYGPLLERAIGVVYRPDTELQSHYFDAELPRQFDLLIHAETTSAVRPLEAGDEEAPEELAETRGDMPELWPSGV